MLPKPSITQESIERLRQVEEVSWYPSGEDKRLDTELIKEVVKETLDDRDDATLYYLDRIPLSKDIDRHLNARGFSTG